MMRKSHTVLQELLATNQFRTKLFRSQLNNRSSELLKAGQSLIIYTVRT